MITETNNNKKGSAIITAVGMGTVLLIIIAAVFSFSKYRTQTVVQESKRVKALALAEAGLDVAIAELTDNSSFVTHKVTLNPSEKSIEWTDDELPWENKLEENITKCTSITARKAVSTRSCRCTNSGRS